jgi:hypothetical protein
MQMMTKEVQQLVRRFTERLGLDPRGPGIHVLENSTEEIEHGIKRGKPPKLFSAGGGQPLVAGRLEENYLYYTRRFPNDVADNTIGAGALTAQDYLYFINGLGDQGTAAGYFSVPNLTLQQTNMAAGGKIPTGRGFRMFDLGITFNARALVGNIAQCMDCMNLRFEKQSGQLVLQHGPIKFWPGGMGVYANTTATATTAASNGFPALTNVRRWRNPRILSANEQFQYVINVPATTVSNNNSTIALTDFVEITIWLFGQVLDTIPN